MKPVSALVLVALILIAMLSFVFRRGNPLASDADAMSSANNSISRSTVTNSLAPEIVSATWLNSAPLSSADLRGKVVLVEFWTFACVNCQNALPYMRALYQKYHDQDLVVIGVHTPELSFERDLANVKSAIKDQNIPYPVAVDNDFKNWNAYKVWGWPTWFILDKQGAIRFTHVGEGAYAESEQAVVNLLREGNP